MAERLSHPRYHKQKHYAVVLNKPLTDKVKNQLESGVKLDDGISTFELSGSGDSWKIILHEGRNRQIRRTFEAIDYRVKSLHRTNFGPFKLENLKSGHWREVEPGELT